MSLIDKLKKSRQSNIDVNGHKFTITRPTDYDALVISRDSINMLDVVKQFTVDWDLSELEIIPGGSGDQIPFDTELFAEWVSDQPAIWEPLANAIIAAYKAHTERRESTAKN
jgi:hypothetical protein